MKILHVITGLGLGGAETVLARLAIATAHQHEVTVVSLSGDDYYASALRGQGIDVVLLGMPPGRITRSGISVLWKTLKDKQPELVQTWMYHADLLGGVLAKFAVDAPIVWGIRNSNLDAGQVSRSTRFVVRVCALLSHSVPDRIVSCSKVSSELHQQLGYARHKFEYIPNGYDLDQYAPASDDARAHTRQKLNIPIESFAMGMVARYDAQKDHRTLLMALQKLKAELPSFHCVLIGAGLTSDNYNVHNLLAKLQLQSHVKLLGVRSDVHRIVAALDLHVLSSAYGEAFPNAVAEGMACGVPSVVTDVGDAKYIVGEEGWVAPARNFEALSEAIKSAMLEHKTAHTSYLKRKQKCRDAMLRQYSLNNMITNFNALWALLSTKNS